MNKIILIVLALTASQLSGCSTQQLLGFSAALDEFNKQQANNPSPAVNYPAYTPPQVMELQPSRTYDHYYCRNTGPITSCKEL